MKNKQIIITVAAVVVAFIVGYFVGDSSAISRANKQVDARVESQQENKPEEKKEETKTYEVGEEGNSGNWGIKVLEAKEATTVQGGDGSSNKTTKEKFIVIKLQMKNISKQPVQYAENEFMLGSMKDKSQYTINDSASNAMSAANNKETIYKENNSFIGVYNDVNPNTTKQTYVVFEVPKSMNLSDCVLINANGEAEAQGFYLK